MSAVTPGPFALVSASESVPVSVSASVADSAPASVPVPASVSNPVSVPVPVASFRRVSAAVAAAAPDAAAVAATDADTGPGSESGSGSGSGSVKATLSPVPSLAVILVAIYAVVVLALARSGPSTGGIDYLLAGRRLTLPAFVATLVTTWYGGILGVGEYAFRFGISTWVVFGLPYYAAALIFAFWLAPRLRASGAASIPELLLGAYGERARFAGATAIFAMTVPVAYLLMLATLLTQLTGWPPLVAVTVGAAFSALYVGLSGFRSVVRTDVLQFALMYAGFFILLPAALAHTGGLAGLWSSLPAGHRSWDGGLGWQTVLVWYLIALQTMVEPSFYQRVFAARSSSVARSGVIVSVGLWAVFDFFSIGCGLAARVLLPGLEDPLTAYPALAEMVLPSWLAAFFTLALFATVMSTLDSYLFLSAATVGHDFTTRQPSPSDDRRRVRMGLALSALLASAGALVFDSAVTVWHHVGSVVTSALLLPVVGVHLPQRWRYRPAAATDGHDRIGRGGSGLDSRRRRCGIPFRRRTHVPRARRVGVRLGRGQVQRRGAETQRRRAIAGLTAKAQRSRSIVDRVGGTNTCFRSGGPTDTDSAATIDCNVSAVIPRSATSLRLCAFAPLR